MKRIERVTVAPNEVLIQWHGAERIGLTVPWSLTPTRRQRRIVSPSDDAVARDGAMPQRPIRVEARAAFAQSTADAHRWLDELVSDPTRSTLSIAKRESRSERSVRMTLTLALLSPDLIRAAIEGALPRGFGIKRLIELPPAWAEQWRAIWLRRPVEDRG